MPLPISARTYMPNPLIQVDATKAGASVGSPFSNFVEGVFSGAKEGIGIQKGLQELELAPREQARRERQTTIQEQRLELSNRQEDRLQGAQEFEEDYKTQTLGIKRDEVQIKRDTTDAKIRKKRADTALAAQKQAETNIIGGAVDDLIVDGSVDSIDAILADPNKRMRGKLLEKIIKDPERGGAVAERLEDAISEGRVNRDTMNRLNSFLRSLEYGKNISTSQEIAEAGAPILVSTLGARPRKDSLLKIDDSERKQDPNSPMKVFEIDSNGGKSFLGVIPPETEPKTMQALYPAMSAHNRMVQMQRQLSRSIQQTAEIQNQQQQLGEQPDQPTKISRTPAQRVGLKNLAQTDVDNETAQAAKQSPAQVRKRQAALERIRKRTNPEAIAGEQKKQALKTIGRAMPVVGPLVDLID